MDKAILLNTIQTEHARFEALIAPLSETQLCTATGDGEWSVKDIMARFLNHCCDCRQFLQAL